MKKPVRIVLDTNVLISALLKTESLPGKVLDLVLSGEVKLVINSDVFEEYETVLSRAKFKFEIDPRNALISYLAAVSKWSENNLLTVLEIDAPDKGDLPFINLSVTSKADALVTGNSRHFQILDKYQVPVMSPGEFLTFIGSVTFPINTQDDQV